MIHEDITLGPVRLIRGDCLKIAPTLEGVDAVITDPPYGISLDTDYTRFRDGKQGVKGRSDLRKRHAPVVGDFAPFDPTLWISYPTALLWGANNFSEMLPSGSWLFWDKRADNGHAMMSEGEAAWMNNGRRVYYFDHCWHGFSRSSENSEHYHPTQKPVALMSWCMDMAKVPLGALVLDPYMGSGTTLIAAIRTGRRAIGIEIDERHFRTAVERVKRELAQPMLPAMAPQRVEQQDLIA